MRTTPGSVNIHLAKFPAAKPTPSIDPAKAASQVVDTFNQALEKQEYAILAHLFLENGYWRDHLAVTWALRTLRTPPNILGFVQSSSHSRDGFRLRKIAIDDSTPFRAPKVANVDAAGEVAGVTFFITLDTAIGTGTGLVSLAEEDGEWKIFHLYTRLDQITGHEEEINGRRPHGVKHGGRPGRKNWKERRQAEVEFETEEPAVLIVGMS